MDALIEQQEKLVAELQAQALKFAHNPNVSRDTTLALSASIDKLATLHALRAGIT